jgi:hypothetical protein
MLPLSNCFSFAMEVSQYTICVVVLVGVCYAVTDMDYDSIEKPSGVVTLLWSDTSIRHVFDNT